MFSLSSSLKSLSIPQLCARTGLFVAVLALALFLRFEASAMTVVDTPVRADARDYVLYAVNLKAFGTYSLSDAGLQEPRALPQPDSMRPPAYPILLSSLIELPLSEGFIGKILRFQNVLGAITVLAVFMLGWVVLGFWPALLAFTLTALSPHLVSMETYLLTETLFACLLILAVLLLIVARREPDRRSSLIVSIVAGCLLAASALTRSTSLYFPLALVILAFWLPQWRRVALVAVAAFVLAYSPWVIRNAMQDHVKSDELTKSFLQHGMYPDMKYRGQDESLGIPYRFDPEAARSRESVTTVLEEIRSRFKSEPFRHLQWYLIGKPVMFWQWSIIAGQGDIFVYPVTYSPYLDKPLHVATRLIMKALHPYIVITAMAACALVIVLVLLRRRAASGRLVDMALVAFVLAYVVLLHMIGAPFPRYSIPFRPELYLVFAWAVSEVSRSAISRYPPLRAAFARDRSC